MSDDEYTADSITVLTPREAARKRPGMYVGDPSDGSGALNLLLEVLANPIDQVLLGRCTHIDVLLGADDSVTIADDGPGIPADTLLDLLERHSNRPTVDGHQPHVHLGQPGIGGIGLMFACALSDPFEVDTVHAGEQAITRHAGGLRSAPLTRGPSTRPSGTRVRFRPDPLLFPSTRVPRVELTRHLEDLACLLPPLSLSWTVAGDAGAGLGERVRAQLGAPLGGVAHHRGDYPGEHGPITVELALAWSTTSRAAPQIHSFANLRRTDAGVHVDGLLAGIRSFLPRRTRDQRLDGLVAALAVLLPDAHYGSPTRSTLMNPDVGPAVKQATLTALNAWAQRHPEAALTLRTRA